MSIFDYPVQKFPDLSFDDVLIVPQYSEIEHRSNVNVSSSLVGTTKVAPLALPVISANMRHITGPKMCIAMREAGGLGILHRFCPMDQNVEDFTSVKGMVGDQYLAGVSIGVKEEDKQRFWYLCGAGAKIVCIDVAHGHHINVKRMLEWIGCQFKTTKDKPFIIAGNIATSYAALDLLEWGADVLKVGIGPGSACQTRKNTGIGVSQFSALLSIKSALVSRGISNSIIADGGISETGHIPKALMFADAVMIAKMIAGTTETPGKVYENEQGQLYKVFGGSASGENKVANGGEAKFVEGSMKPILFCGRVKYILRKIKETIQMSFSYVGARNLAEFRERAEWRIIGSGAQKESKIG